MIDLVDWLVLAGDLLAASSAADHFFIIALSAASCRDFVFSGRFAGGVLQDVLYS